ncbi:MAG TPA: hypothetical protein VG053_07105 [Solirubrobacteraceae bacterium]|nr:hypothetical protein [Solirubrobacteraceae bacterium]
MGFDLGESAARGLDLPQALDLYFHTRSPQCLACEVVNKTRQPFACAPKNTVQVGMTFAQRLLTQPGMEVWI